LSQAHRTGLVLWSCGIVLAQSCGLTTVATFLAYLLGRGEVPVREQLRDWYRDGVHKRGAKRGDKRRSLEVATCFAPLLRWVVAWSDPTCRHLALAMDASTLGQRFTVLLISVVVRGCAIPVAWRIVEATRPGCLAPTLGSALWPCAGPWACRLDRHCPGRSGPLGPLGLHHHSGVG